MNRRQTLLLGLAGMGLVLALPVKAAPVNGNSGFMVVKYDSGERDYDARNRDESPHAKGNPKQPPREVERHRPDSEGYGYGYERRERQQPSRDDDDRGRR